MFQPIQRDVNCFAWGRSPIGQLCFLSLLFCGAQILTIPRDKSWFFIAWKATQNLQTDVRKLVFSLIIYIYIYHIVLYIYKYNLSEFHLLFSGYLPLLCLESRNVFPSIPALDLTFAVTVPPYLKPMAFL